MALFSDLRHLKQCISNLKPRSERQRFKVKSGDDQILPEGSVFDSGSSGFEILDFFKR